MAIRAGNRRPRGFLVTRCPSTPYPKPVLARLKTVAPPRDRPPGRSRRRRTIDTGTVTGNELRTRRRCLGCADEIEHPGPGRSQRGPDRPGDVAYRSAERLGNAPVALTATAMDSGSGMTGGQASRHLPRFGSTAELPCWLKAHRLLRRSSRGHPCNRLLRTRRRRQRQRRKHDKRDRQPPTL